MGRALSRIRTERLREGLIDAAIWGRGAVVAPAVMGGGEPACPLNQQVYIATEGASSCTPIPFTHNPDMGPCPAGYALDLATERQLCLPTD